jgi:hypothetical protein
MVHLCLVDPRQHAVHPDLRCQLDGEGGCSADERRLGRRVCAPVAPAGPITDPTWVRILADHYELLSAVEARDPERAADLWHKRMHTAVREFLELVPDREAIEQKRPWLWQLLSARTMPARGATGHFSPVRYGLWTSIWHATSCGAITARC